MFDDKKGLHPAAEALIGRLFLKHLAPGKVEHSLKTSAAHYKKISDVYRSDLYSMALALVREARVGSA